MFFINTKMEKHILVKLDKLDYLFYYMHLIGQKENETNASVNC